MVRLKVLLWLAALAASLFVPAGTYHWRGAWIFLVVLVGSTMALMGWLARTDPALYAERRRKFRHPNQPGWDRRIGLAIGLVWFTWLMAMSLAVRFYGADASPLQLGAGIGLIAAGMILCAQSFRANTFAATSVRLQPERGQRPVDTGPYGWVRHPIYAASLLVHSGTFLLLGPRWGGLGYGLLAFLLGLRAVLEERTLKTGLPGYADYMGRVRWRLIPGIW